MIPALQTLGPAVAYAVGHRIGRINPFPRRIGEFEVKTSSIHGLGVFSTSVYDQDDLVGLYEGRVAWEDNGSHYFMTVQEEKTAEEDGGEEQDMWGVIGDGPLMYLNDAKEPSCYVDGVLIYAARAIGPGDELTIDYGYDEDLEWRK